MTPEDATPCPCRALEPHSGTYDLEKRVVASSEATEDALLVRTAPDLIECRRCGRSWRGEALLGGGIYGDTLWQVQ